MAAAATSPTTAPSSFPSTARKSTLPSLRISRKLKLSAAALSSGPSPAFRSVTAFAPATVANLGPCFDFLGCAVADASLSLGDTVTATFDHALPPGTVAISAITSPARPDLAARLSRNPLHNCAGIAAAATLRALGVRSHAVSLTLAKGLPLGSGLGSSAASAAAAVKAVDALFGSLLSPHDLVLAGLESEKAVSGYHADNIAPAIHGGFVLVQSYNPFKLVQLLCPPALNLCFVLVTPDFEAPTAKIRAALPEHLDISQHIRNAIQAAALVAAVMQGDAAGIGFAMSSDCIVEPARVPLIPGMAAVKAAALKAGALGCTISVAGPTAVAVIQGARRVRRLAGEWLMHSGWQGSSKQQPRSPSSIEPVPGLPLLLDWSRMGYQDQPDVFLVALEEQVEDPDEIVMEPLDGHLDELGDPNHFCEIAELNEQYNDEQVITL